MHASLSESAPTHAERYLPRLSLVVPVYLTWDGCHNVLRQLLRGYRSFGTDQQDQLWFFVVVSSPYHASRFPTKM
jgi:hypothetical protein